MRRQNILTLMVLSLALGPFNVCAAADKNVKVANSPMHLIGKLRGSSQEHRAHNKPDGSVLQTMGLRGVVTQAEYSSAQLRATIADTDAANARVWKAIAQYAPTITGSISADQPIGSHSASTDDVTSYANINLSVPIFTSGRRYFGVKSARSAATAKLFEGLAASDDLKQTTIKAYLNYYYARSSQALFSANLKDLNRMKIAVEKRRVLGFASMADMYQIKADVASLELEVVNAGKIMGQAKAELESLVGRSFKVPSRLPKIRHLVEGGRVAMLRSALHNNPNLLAATHSAKAADYTSKETYGKYLPQVNLVSDYNRNISGQTSSGSSELNVGVKLTMPLVNLSTVSEIKENRSRAQAAHYRSLDTKRLIELRTNTLWQEYISNNARVKLAAKKVEAIRWGVRSRLAKFHKGLISIDPVLEQKRVLALAEMAMIQIKTDQFFATSQLLITAGILKNSMLDG